MPRLCLDGIEVREFVKPGNEKSQSFHIGYNRSSVELAQNAQISLRFWYICINIINQLPVHDVISCHICINMYVYIRIYIYYINLWNKDLKCSCHLAWLISSHPLKMPENHTLPSASRNLDCAMNSPGLVWDPVRKYGPGSQTSTQTTRDHVDLKAGSYEKVKSLKSAKMTFQVCLCMFRKCM